MKKLFLTSFIILAVITKIIAQTFIDRNLNYSVNDDGATVTLTGFIDTLLKFTVIWIIPSKIGGALFGFIEAWLFVFLVLFVLVQFNFTNSFITSSTVSNVILDHTPIVGSYLGGATRAANNIYASVKKYASDEIKTTKELNVEILNIEIVNGILSKQKANELIETGKLKLEGVMFGKEDSKWSNI